MSRVYNTSEASAVTEGSLWASRYRGERLSW